MLGLVNLCQEKLKLSKQQNKELKNKVLLLETQMEERNAESEEFEEISLVYSKKISQLEKQLSKEKNKDDDSYIEITFPFTPL